VDTGFGNIEASYDLDGHPRLSCRVWGINAPELSTAEGKAALAYALELCPPGTRVTVVSHGWDKFGGRWDGSITLPDGSDFGQRMLAAGQAVPFAP
jgi:endonuclease YncB( thermonuclease family)